MDNLSKLKLEKELLSFYLKCFLIVSGILMIFCISFVFAEDYPNIGSASYYTKESCQREGTSGVFTASNEVYNENGLTCALRSRDFGGYYKVTNLVNNKSVIVKHNDFGPSKRLFEDKNRIVDLSKSAFAELSDLKNGIIEVKIERVK